MVIITFRDADFYFVSGLQKFWKTITRTSAAAKIYRKFYANIQIQYGDLAIMTISLITPGTSQQSRAWYS